LKAKLLAKLKTKGGAKGQAKLKAKPELLILYCDSHQERRMGNIIQRLSSKVRNEQYYTAILIKSAE